MSNRNIDLIVGNCAFLLAVLFYAGGLLVNSLAGEDFPGESSFVEYVFDIALFAGIPSMLLINAMCGLRPACASWWSMLKGIISFVYLAICTPGIGRFLESIFGENAICVDVVVVMFHAITLAVITLPIIGLIRKKKKATLRK